MCLDKIEEINNLLNQSESKDQSQKGEAINLLGDAFSMYEQLRKDRGRAYCSNKCPNIPRRMNVLVKKLIEYDS